jgi:hypothetical protein
MSNLKICLECAAPRVGISSVTVVKVRCDVDEEKVDETLSALKDIANRGALEALKKDLNALPLIEALHSAGLRLQLTVGVVAMPAGPTRDQEEMAKGLASQRRWCPHCSIPESPFHLRSHIVKERVAGDGERDVIEGLQVRFTCSICGYGEVESVE